MGNIQCTDTGTYSLAEAMVDQLNRADCVNGPFMAVMLESSVPGRAPIILFGEDHSDRFNPECKHLDEVISHLLPNCAALPMPKPVHVFLEEDPDSSVVYRKPPYSISNVARYRYFLQRERNRCLAYRDQNNLRIYNADIFYSVRVDAFEAGRDRFSTGFKTKCIASCRAIARIAKQPRPVPLSFAKSRHEHIKAVKDQITAAVSDWKEPYRQFIQRQFVEHSFSAHQQHQSRFASITLREHERIDFNLLALCLSALTDCYVVKAMINKSENSQLILGYWGAAHVNNQIELLTQLGYRFYETIQLH